MTLQTPGTSVVRRDHAVQFYDHDSELARAVGAYLAESLRSGAVAIVIATEAHRRAFAAELRAAGVDPVERERSTSLTTLDAAATLARLTVDGKLDRDAFRRVVGTLVREAASSGRPVRAFGEMVCLLWEAGDVLGAIELEKFWNELQQEVEFSLLCAYQSAAVAGDEHADPLQQICHLHTSVVHAGHQETNGFGGATPEVERSAEFPADVPSAPGARQFVVDALRNWGYGGTMLDDARLVISELATNAIIHARAPFSVAAQRSAGAIRLVVQDPSPALPRLLAEDPSSPSGRGLRVVDALAREWGVEAAGPGKAVWAELRP